jgi:phospholipid-binding lipoprotein MlaA
MPSAFMPIRVLFLSAIMAVSLLSGCASTGNPRDPLEPINRGVYQFNEGVDNILLKPVAQVYQGVLPPFVRTGVSNFFSNINDVLVALNNLLQGKVVNAASDVGRLVVNTTAGLLGFIDVATHIGLEKHDEDFGQTLGYWGIGSGPYLVLPLFGPSSARDAIARIVDRRGDLLTYVDPTRDRNQLWAARIINRRSELLGTSKILETAALDPYEFLRDAYLQRRRNMVYDGNPPRDDDDDTEIRVKPRPEQKSENSPFPPSAEGSGTGSVWYSGDFITPAQEEAATSSASPSAAAETSQQDANPQADPLKRLVRALFAPAR